MALIGFTRSLMSTLGLWGGLPWIAAFVVTGIMQAAEPPQAVSLPSKEKFHLYLLVGQSNMAGRGKVEPQDQVPHPRILMLDKQNQWRPAIDPLHFDKPSVVGVGLGSQFAREIVAADPDVVIGLIPCAAGGSPISSWQPGGYHEQTKSHPYDDALRRAKVALEAGQLRGILWHQGESDCTPELAPVYEQALHALIARLRRELNAPRVPFIVGQLGQFPERPWNESMRQVDSAHRNLPDRVPMTAFVSSEGLKDNGDKTHFDAGSYREFGRRYAAAYRDLVETRLLFGSCARQDRPLPIFAAILAQKPDLFVFLGDNIYADTSDMQEMRAKYALLQADAGFTQLRQNVPVFATWDDHDYGLNDAGSEYAQKAAAQQLFVDFWQDRADSPRRTRPGVYDVQYWGSAGRRIQLLLLDTRYFRGPLQRTELRDGGPYQPTSDAAVPLLGEAQWKWLEDQLQQPADLRILATSIQCLPEAAGQECWANLPHEQQRLFDLLAKTQAKGVLLLSGDRHWAELSSRVDGVPYPLYEVTSSSLNQPHPRGTPTVNRFRAVPETWHRENFGQLVIDWSHSDPTIQMQVRDAQGTLRISKQVTLSQLQPQ